MNELALDIRQGFRLLRTDPGFTCVAVLTLALGIGANSAIFGVIDAVMLHPFPYERGDEILFLSEQNEQGTMPVNWMDFRDWQSQVTVFEHLAAARGFDFNLTGIEEPARVHAGLVSASVFPLLGMEPLLGRVFGPEDDREGAERVVVLGHGLWQARFGGETGILGRTIQLDDQSYTVVGVMPPAFQFWAGELWVPIGLNFDGEFAESRIVRNGTFAVARLAPGLSIEEAEAEMGVIAERLAREHPETNEGVGVRIITLTESVVAGIRPALLILLGAVGFILLIACANVANLLLVRAAAREREMAIRTALGASRGRMVRQLLVETVPLALLGAAAGLVLAFWALKGLVAVVPADAIPIEAEIGLDLRVLAFGVGLALLTAIGFGILPALQTSHVDVTERLREGARGSSSGWGGNRARGLLVGGEVALSLALLVGAGLLINSFWRLHGVDPGFRPEGVLKLMVSLPEQRYPDRERSGAFFRSAIERIEALPGVRHAAVGPLPFSGSGGGMPLVAEGETYASIDDLQIVQYGVVEGEFFQSLGIPLLKGRHFGPYDTGEAPGVALLSASAVKRHFARVDPLGKRI